MDIPQILEDLDIEYKEHGEHRHATYGWIQVCCPFCGDSNYKLGISLEWGGCSCWACGTHKLPDVLAEITGQTRSSFYSLLKRDFSLDKKDRIKRGKLVLPKGLKALDRIHRKYLKSRGFDPDELTKLWGLQGIGLCAKLPFRIFIPVHFRGEIVSWTTRKAQESGPTPRYINAKPEEEVYSIRSLLYGADYVRHAIALVEGPTDVWRIGPGAAATLGVAYTPEQVAKIARYPVRVIIFDADLSAQQRATELLETLSVLPGATYKIQLDAKDPGSASEKEIVSIRKNFLD